MNYPLQSLMQMGVVPAVNYPPDSRYYRYSTLQYTAPNGQTISYLARRIVPATGSAQFFHHRPARREAGRPAGSHRRKISRISAGVLADLRRQWRQPSGLVETPGTVIDITTPQGVPGASA